MKKVLSIICALVLVACVAPGVAAAEAQEEVVDAKAQKARGAGDDENIKKDEVANDPDAPLPAPPGKGGEKTRGRLCSVVLDNWTGWHVTFYVDGNYWGMAPPYGEVLGLAFAGGTRVYARANFVDGTYYYWGPQVFSCGRDQVYRWKVGR